MSDEPGDKIRRLVASAEQLEIARPAKDAARAAARAATAARRANIKATIALVIATISIVTTIIGIWIIHHDLTRPAPDPRAVHAR